MSKEAPAATLLLLASAILQTHGSPQTPGFLPGLGAGAGGGNGCRLCSKPYTHWVPLPFLTFCSASRSGLPCVNAKMGSLATFREEVCFHRSLDAKVGKRGRQVSRDHHQPQPLSLQQGGLCWPRILKSRATIEPPGHGNRRWGPKTKVQAQIPVLLLCVLGQVTCFL